MSTPNRPVYDEQSAKRIIYKQARSVSRQRKIITKQTDTIDEQAKTIMALFEEIDDLCEKVDELSLTLNQKIDRLAIVESCATNDIFNIRSYVLSDVAKSQISRKRTLARHVSAHGGNIVADIEAIDRMNQVNPECAFKWRGAFEKLYGLSFDRHKSTIISTLCGIESDSSAIRYLITTCNIKATMQVMSPWKEANHTSSILLCDVLIAACIDNDFSLEYWQRPVTVRVFNVLVRSYNDV